MKTNVGAVDRVLRVVIGLGLISLLFVLDSGARWLGLIGLVPLLTAGLGYCPLYALFGISSCPLKRASV